MIIDFLKAVAAKSGQGDAISEEEMTVFSSPAWVFIQKLHTHVAAFWKIQNTNQYLGLFGFSHIDLFTGPLLAMDQSESFSIG